jgi:hypothetical protein
VPRAQLQTFGKHWLEQSSPSTQQLILKRMDEIAREKKRDVLWVIFFDPSKSLRRNPAESRLLCRRPSRAASSRKSKGWSHFRELNRAEFFWSA